MRSRIVINAASEHEANFAPNSVLQLRTGKFSMYDDLLRFADVRDGCRLQIMSKIK